MDTKSFGLILIGIIAISCMSMSILTVESVSAQAIPRPSVPEFTAKFTASSLEVTIKNQPLTGLGDINVSNPQLYYGFRFKDPNSTLGGWEYAPIYFVGLSSYGTYYEASASDYTIISFPLDDYPFDGANHRTGISKGDPIDMQVIALIGIEVPTDHQGGKVYRFDGVTSDWSNTRTITIPSENPLIAPAMTLITPMPVTYQNSSVPLFFGAKVLTDSPEIISLSYSLDGNDNTTITEIGKTGMQHFETQTGFQTGYTYHINDTLTLDNLTDGNHTLLVYSQDAIGTEMSGSVQFTVDTANESSTEPVPYYSWLLAALIIGLVLLVSIFVLLLRRHRKSNEKVRLV